VSCIHATSGRLTRWWRALRDRWTDAAVAEIILRLDHEEALEDNDLLDRIPKPSKCSSTQGEYRPDALDEGEVLSEPLGLKPSAAWEQYYEDRAKRKVKPPLLTDTGQPPVKHRCCCPICRHRGQ